jgi:hypothetical protein
MRVGVEMTQSNSPQSQTQKYQLIDAGRRILGEWCRGDIWLRRCGVVDYVLFSFRDHDRLFFIDFDERIATHMRRA